MFVVCSMVAGVKLWYVGGSERWTPDINGAKRFTFGVDTFQTGRKVWIEFAPK